MITINVPTAVEISDNFNKYLNSEFIDSSIDYTINVSSEVTVYEFVDMIANVMRQFGYQEQSICDGFNNYLDTRY